MGIKQRITLGDARKWLLDDMKAKLAALIEREGHRPDPYYILVTNVKPGVRWGSKEQKPLQAEGKHVIATRFVIIPLEKLEEYFNTDVWPKVFGLINTMLWYVNNKYGQIECVYVLPADKPITAEIVSEEHSKIVHESATRLQQMGVPLVN